MPETETIPPLLKASEAAPLFGRDAEFVKRLIRRGDLIPVRLGRSVFVRRSDVMKLTA